MSAVSALHGLTFRRRLRVLVDRIEGLLEPGQTVLDLGCGDGQLGSRLLALRPDLTIFGADTMSRLSVELPAFQFDGWRLPLRAEAVDIVLMVDVVHHTIDPGSILAEAGRVASKGIVIKDHLREGILAERTLRFMDRVGNARYGVSLPYNYLNRHEWAKCFELAQLHVDAWEERLQIYPAPLGWAFDRSLHFVARLEKKRNDGIRIPEKSSAMR